MKEFISIKAAIPDVLDSIDESLVSTSDIIEWSAKAMGQIDCYETYEEDVALINISNYQGWLPKGLLQINQIAYRTDDGVSYSSLAADDYEKLINALKVTKIESDLTTNLKLKSFLSSDYFIRNWAPMRASTSSFMLSVLCANSPNLTANCEAEYTVKPNGKIITDCKDATLIISYTRSPLDDNGDYLIPNDDELIETLRLYCLYRIWEKRYNYKEEGAGERYRNFKAEWRIHKHMMRGKLKLPTSDQYQNILDYSNNLLPRKDRYYSYFGTLNVPDQTFF